MLRAVSKAGEVLAEALCETGAGKIQLKVEHLRLGKTVNVYAVCEEGLIDRIDQTIEAWDSDDDL
jgi:hypothetical protein